MKNINQLKKRILKEVTKEQWNEDFRKAIVEGRLTGKTQYWIETVDIMIKKAIDKTLQEGYEEIENRILYLNKEKDKKGKKKVGDIVYLHIYDMINELKELLKTFQGEENGNN